MAATSYMLSSGGIGRRLARAWRALRTLLAFVIFGVLGLLTAGVAVPFVRLTTRGREATERRIQRIVQRLFRFFCSVLEGLGLARITFSGAHHAAVPGRLVVANHPTLIDAVAILACMPQAICVTKQEIFQNPFMRGSVRAAGYLPNEDGPAVVEACTRILRDGKSLLLFPEGTRSPAHGMREFKRGAAHVALRSGCEIVPVTVSCDPPTLMKGQKWWDVPEHAFHLHVAMHEPVRIADCAGATLPRPRAARALTAAMREWISGSIDGVPAAKPSHAPETLPVEGSVARAVAREGGRSRLGPDASEPRKPAPGTPSPSPPAA